jgi:hypothetical protein
MVSRAPERTVSNWVLSRVRWLFRISWVSKQPAYFRECATCKGCCMVDLPTGLAAVVETANSMPCGDCAGLGGHWVTYKPKGKVAERKGN